MAAGVGARFHSGFLDALNEIWGSLFPALESWQPSPGRRLWVTGHSLGGAIAQLAAWRLERNFIQVHQVYTFGAPMVGNAAASAAFQRQFPGRIFRFIDTRDLVPKLPAISLFTNEYRHCDTEVPLGPADARDVPKELAGQAVDSLLNATMIDQVWGQLHQGVDSHLMPNYLARIRERLSA